MSYNIIALLSAVILQSKPFCSRRKAIHCFVPLIPILMFALAITVAIPSFLTRDQSKSSMQEYEIASTKYPFPDPYPSNCYNTNISNVAPLIRLGTLYSRWYGEVVINQPPNNGHYVPLDFRVYTVPSEHVIEKKKRIYCSGTFSLLNINQLYLLNGSVMKINVCINSTSNTLPGWVDLFIYDHFESYHSTRNPIGHHRIYVGANQSKCSSYNYTAQNDSLYYASAGNLDETCRASVTSFSVDIEIKYINVTELLNGSTSYRFGVCNKTKSCSVAISDEWFFSASNHDIFVFVTSSSKLSELGLVGWQLSFQTLWYAVPAIGGAIIILPIFLITVGCSYCVYRKRGHGIEYEELRSHI